MELFFKMSIVLTAVILSACGGLNEQVRQHDDYLPNDNGVKKVYDGLYADLSDNLKIALENNQKKWQQDTFKNCTKNSQTQKQCQATANHHRLSVLTHHQKHLANLLNKELNGLEKANGKYVGAFDAYCMCGVIFPFIDTKNNTIIWKDFCTNVIEKHPIDNVILSDDGISFIMTNTSGSNYELMVKYHQNGLYKVMMNGDYDLNQTVYIPTYLANKKLYPIDADLICGDFDG